MFHLYEGKLSHVRCKHNFAIYLDVKSESEVSQLCPTLVTSWTVAYQVLCPWDFPGKSTGVGFHCLLQEIFPTQGLNPGLQHCRQMILPPEPQGS